MGENQTKIRLDKWLWYARFFKTRTLCSKFVASGKVRLNSVKITKPSVLIRKGDTLTFVQGRAVRVVRLVGVGTRRGPAVEAQALYEDLSPPVATESRQPTPVSERVGGRPTKQDRRALDRLRGESSG